MPVFRFGFRAPLLVASLLLTSCAQQAVERHELALAVSAKNAELTQTRNDEQDALVLSIDARERASLETNLDLVWQLSEARIEAKFTRELLAASELLAPVGGTGGPSSASGPESRPVGGAPLDDGAPPRRVVALAPLEAMLAEHAKQREATRVAIAAKRKAITDRLDGELRRWLADPKKRQQERIAAALRVYAHENSEFVRFLATVEQGFGLGGGSEQSVPTVRRTDPLIGTDGD